MLLADEGIRVAGFGLMDEAQAMFLAGDVNGGLDHVILGLRELKRRSDHQEWQRFCEVEFLEHPLTELVHQCPMTAHSFQKPRGYAGDAELLDWIYGIRQPGAEISGVGRDVLSYCVEATVPQSVRARRDVLAQTVDKVAVERGNGIQVLSVACGHLREAALSEAMKAGQVSRWIAFDQDPLSLGVVEQDWPKGVIETQQGSVGMLVREKQTYEGLDLVYAAGLYDYLSQPMATRLTRVMFDMLRPGGRLLVANFVPDHREIGYMETFMGWQLLYRTESELVDVAAEIPVEQVAEQKTFLEPNGNIVFLELAKA